jgi:hypothetical protein
VEENFWKGESNGGSRLKKIQIPIVVFFSAEVKKSQVILQIVLPLLAKALYGFGFFEGIL